MPVDDKQYYLTDGDRDWLRTLVEDYQGRIGNTQQRGTRDRVEDEEHQAPEVYVAKTPALGIPKLVDSGGGNQVPGKADCLLFRVNPGTTKLEPLSGGFRTVYNLGTSDINMNSWVLVHRDKLGYWFVGASSGGSGSLTTQDLRYCTALTQKVLAGDTTIHVQSCALMPSAASSPVIIVEKEHMLVTIGCPSLTWTVTRGVDGTVAVDHPNYAPVCLVLPGIFTDLNGAIDNVQTTIIVDSQEWFPSFGRYYIYIVNDDGTNPEEMLVIDGAGSTTWTVVRGQNGTTAVSHPDEAKVYWRMPDKVKAVQRMRFNDWALVQPSTPDEDTNGVAMEHHEAARVVLVLDSNPIPGSIYYDANDQVRDFPGGVWVTTFPVYVLNLN